MILRYGHRETLKRRENKTQVLTPAGLQNFSQRVISLGLASFSQSDTLTKIRILPISGIEDGETAAHYKPGDDRIEVKLPMNLLWMYYLQRTLANLDGFIAETTPRLQKLSAESLKSLGMDKKFIIKALSKSSKKPHYLPESQEQYDLNRKFEVAKKILDIFQEFILAYEKKLHLQLSAQDFSSLISLAHFIEDYLGAISDDQVLQKLSDLPLLPHSYSFLCIVFKVDPQTLEISDDLIESISGSVEHEKIHQIFCQSSSHLRIEIRDKRAKRIISEKEETPPESADDISDRQWQRYVTLTDRKNRCLSIVSDVVEEKRSFSEIYNELTQINRENIHEILDGVQPLEAVHGFLLDFVDVGFQEAAIAILTAQKAGFPFLSNLYQYVTEPNFILPPLHILDKMQEIAQKHGSDIQSAVTEMIATVYRQEEIRTYADRLLEEFKK